MAGNAVDAYEQMVSDLWDGRRWVLGSVVVLLEGALSFLAFGGVDVGFAVGA